MEDGQRLKVIYGSDHGFHAIDLDTSQVFDIYIPSQVSRHDYGPSHESRHDYVPSQGVDMTTFSVM